MNKSITYLISNTTDKDLILYDFINELYDEKLTLDYPIARLQTDTFGITQRFFKPGAVVEVEFLNEMCILGRLMDKLHKGKTKSFVYLKICDGKNFLLPDGTQIEDPRTIARSKGKEEIFNLNN